jgi:hypothetical protein
VRFEFTAHWAKGKMMGLRAVLSRKAIIHLMTSFALAVLTIVGGQAQTYPVRSPGLIVPFSQGGAY